MSELIVAAMAFALSLMFLTVTVYPAEMDKAQELCSVNGGVERLAGSLLSEPVVTCVNGAVFTFEDAQP